MVDQGTWTALDALVRLVLIGVTLGVAAVLGAEAYRLLLSFHRAGLQRLRDDAARAPRRHLVSVARR